jgi:hypothetical protein
MDIAVDWDAWPDRTCRALDVTGGREAHLEVGALTPTSAMDMDPCG